MKLQNIANFVTSKAGRKVLVLKKHSPKIMFVAGVIGVGATVVLACRATLKVDQVLEEHEKKVAQINNAVVLGEEKFADYSDSDKQRDMAMLYVKTTVEFIKLYGPSIVLGVTSIALLTGAHLVLSRRNVALAAAYAALDKGFQEYRQRVSDQLGPDKERDLRLGLEEHEIEEDGKKKVIKTSIGGRSIYARCFDETSTSFVKDPRMGPTYNPTFLRTTQDWANDKLRANGWLTLNEVYEMLGMGKTKEGMVVGWVLDSKTGDGYVDFGFWDSNQQLVTEFILGQAPGIWINPNVDGYIYDQL